MSAAPGVEVLMAIQAWQPPACIVEIWMGVLNSDQMFWMQWGCYAHKKVSKNLLEMDQDTQPELYDAGSDRL
jgi:hypothetical protein